MPRRDNDRAARYALARAKADEAFRRWQSSTGDEAEAARQAAMDWHAAAQRIALESEVLP